MEGRGGSGHGRELNHVDTSLKKSDFVSITFEFQKKEERDENKVPCVSTKATLYVKLTDQVYAELKSI